MPSSHAIKLINPTITLFKAFPCIVAMFCPITFFSLFSSHPNTPLYSIMTLLFLDFFLELKIVSFLLYHKFIKKLYKLKPFQFFSMISSDPLFSIIVTFCTLIFFYLPHLFLTIVFSPVIILTGVLLLTILRLGATQKFQHEQKKNQERHDSVKEENRARKCREEKEKQRSIKPLERVERSENEVNSETGLEKSSCFVEWNVRAPLEVIYEEYEGEEKWNATNEREENWNMDVLNYSSLNCYFPESDSDGSSDSPTIEEWDEEDGEGLIEIALDGSKRMKMKMDLEFQNEEENLIEIDISPTRYGELSVDSYR